MKTILLLKRLEHYPLFTENDVAKITGQNPASIRTLLYRLHHQGYIQRLEKGKYTLHEDPLIYASYLVTPSYLSLWTALRYHNLTPQQPPNLFIISTVAKKNITINTTTLFFSTSRQLFGYGKERYADFDIFMADPEKTIIDCLLFKIPLSYVEEALEGDFDGGKLIGYARRTENKALIKRLGYLLEQKKGQAYGLTAADYPDYNYTPFDYHGPKKGAKNKKWRLIVNT